MMLNDLVLYVVTDNNHNRYLPAKWYHEKLISSNYAATKDDRVSLYIFTHNGLVLITTFTLSISFSKGMPD